jgi:hypothetical protein
VHQEPLLTKATNALALGGVSLPAWWPGLQETSEVSVLLVPIVSLVWLVVQIVRFLRTPPDTGKRGDTDK